MSEKTKLNEQQQALWDNIKDVRVEYFGLKGQKVHMVCEPINIDPESLYISLKGPAAIRSLEDAFELDCATSIMGEQVPKFLIENAGPYAIVTYNPKVPNNK